MGGAVRTFSNAIEETELTRRMSRCPHAARFGNRPLGRKDAGRPGGRAAAGAFAASNSSFPLDACGAPTSPDTEGRESCGDATPPRGLSRASALQRRRGAARIIAYERRRAFSSAVLPGGGRIAWRNPGTSGSATSRRGEPSAGNNAASGHLNVCSSSTTVKECRK